MDSATTTGPVGSTASPLTTEVTQKSSKTAVIVAVLSSIFGVLIIVALVWYARKRVLQAKKSKQIKDISAPEWEETAAITPTTAVDQNKDVVRYKTAVLIVNSKQTSCEAALVDSSAALVAASCLQYNGNTVDSTQSYELVIKLGSGDANSQKVSIDTITVHPGYDASSYINNLAVVQFSTGASISWQNYLAVNPDEWDNEYFARHSLTNSYSLTWNNIIAFSTMSTPSDCAKASKVYSENSGDFLCNYAASLSIYNRDCKVPYGTVYAVVQPDDFGVAAIHSHSAIYGDSMCSSDKKLHYYTLLRNYIPWAARVIGRSIGGFSKDTSFQLSIDYDYSMKTVSSTTVSGVEVFAGDRYSQDPVNPALADPAPPASNSTAAVQSTQATTSANAPTTSNAPVTSASANQAAGSSAAATTAGVIDNSAATVAGSNTSSANIANSAQTSGNSAVQTTETSGNVSAATTDSISMTTGTDGSSAASSIEPNGSSDDNSDEIEGSSGNDNGSSDDNSDEIQGSDGDGQAVVLTDISGSQDLSSPTASDDVSSSPTSNSADINIGPSESENLGSAETSDASNSSSANNAAKDNSSSGSKRTIIIVIVIILLLGLIGGGAWWFIRRKRKARQSTVEKNGWNSPRGSVRSSLSPAYLPRGEDEYRGSGFSGVTRGYYGNDRYDSNRVLDYNDAFIEGTQSGGHSARDNRASNYNFQQQNANNQRDTYRYSNYDGDNYRDTFQQAPAHQSAYLNRPIQQQMPMPANSRGNYEGNF
ncbi:hypothetical protein LPJ53_001134 [Coemansia erecta]|uniref:Peptidase S1 domain-containing protein n=1 Tax=Coemansia erecta TaxID=147472 RepID=A0A9W7Y610_9FUNG|nr:hypothetical protein LPJ53_001134 [Coemansia erecta]